MTSAPAAAVPRTSTALALASRATPWLLAAVTAAWTLTHLQNAATSWHFFDTAARTFLAFGTPGGGLHLYHSHPELQFGPVSVLASVPFTVLPLPVARTAAALVLSATVLLLLRGLAALVPGVERWRVLLVGLFLIPAWEILAAGAGHLDDVIALTATVWAMVAVRRDHVVLSGALLAVAVDAKPWAIAFLPLLLALPGRHERLRAAVVAAGGVVAAWLPFALADPGSLAAVGYRIPVGPGSVLRLFDSWDASTPWWCRPVQLLGGAALGVLAWRRNRTVAVVAVVVALRLATDPATWGYYSAGLVVGAALLDLARVADGPALPWLTMMTVIGLDVLGAAGSGPFGDPSVHAWLRLTCCAVVVLVAFAVPCRDLLRARATWPALPAPSRQPSP